VNASAPENEKSEQYGESETVRVMHPHDADLMPAPTSAPIVFAFGTTLAFAGLVTNPWVSIVGVICVVIGVLGWWFQVLPRESMEPIPADGVREIDTGPELGATLPPEAASAQARKVLPVEIPRIRSGIMGGIGGGVAMAIVAMAWGLVHHSIWMPINLLAAMVLSSFDTASVEALRSFSASGLFVALGIHIAFSIMVGLLLAAMMPMAARWPRIFACIVAPFIWSLFLYVTMGVLDPTLYQWVDWYWFFGSQFAFGVVAGLIIARAEKIETVQFLSPSERISLEQTHQRGKGGAS
jgi:hypothetical protein